MHYHTRFALPVLACGLLLGMAACTDDDDRRPAPAFAPTATALSTTLPQAMAEAKCSLVDGLAAAGTDGNTPISGKFEIEDGHLQLSIYTMQGAAFAEVIVNHQAGTVAKREVITDGDDLAAARQQASAMAKATRTLREAVDHAVSTHAGSRAISVMPKLVGEVVTADVTLLTGTQTEQVSESLR